jgi:hypothetical protein
VLTGWGEGLAALPADARRAAGSRSLIPFAAPLLRGERFRRATRECLSGVAAVYALLREAGLGSEAIEGGDTALIYVTAGAYGASNRAFIEAAGAGGRESGGALYFPYTAPSAVPAEVTIEFGLRGPYVILIGGAAATIEALWQAGRMLAEGACARALVLAVETFAECADLYGRGRWLVERPLVEAAACALLLPSDSGVRAGPAERASRLEETVRRRAGETFACAPLIGLALARAAGDDPWELTGRWRGRRLALRGERSPARPQR